MANLDQRINDAMLLIANGSIPGITNVNKFGRSKNVDDGILTDIWDRANTTNDQAIWTAPTSALKHNIRSSDSGDTSGGAGARTIKIYGLPSWSEVETNETITLKGTTSIESVNSYVIIHRMKVLTKGASTVNVGNITATADGDAKVIAQILPGEGQTQMAIYGIPSIQTAFMTNFYASINRATLGASANAADIGLVFNPEPDNEVKNFQVKHTVSIVNLGTSAYQHFYNPYNKFGGPGIFKMQATGGAANLDISAGFDLILINN